VRKRHPDRRTASQRAAAHPRGDSAGSVGGFRLLDCDDPQPGDRETGEVRFAGLVSHGSAYKTAR